MPRSLKLLILGVVAASAVALVAATLTFPFMSPELPFRTPRKASHPRSLDLGWGCVLDPRDLARLPFPSKMPRGTKQAVSIAPTSAAYFGRPGRRRVGRRIRHE